MKVIFPWFLKELKPNWTGHYMQKAKAKAIYRAECAKLTQSAMNSTKRDYTELHLTFYKPNNRHMDLDNMLSSMKSGIDGMCDALEINDKQFSKITIDRANEIGGYVVVELK